MKPVLIIVATLSFTGCNVFYPLNSVEAGGISSTNGTTGSTSGKTTGDTCTASCNCETDCELACDSGCNVECETDATCTGNVPDGSRIECAEDALCAVACTDGTCEFDCSQQSSDCEIDCPDGVTCVLDCGTRRNGTNRDDCGFVGCAGGETECDDGVIVCGGPCP